MRAILEAKRDDVARICERHCVLRLSVFGSAAGDEYAAGRSDIDLRVEFARMPPPDHANHFFGLQDDLEALLGTPVDLVELKPIRNPYFRQAVEAGKVLLFEAA